MNLKYRTIVLTFLLCLTSLPSYAGKIYRFIDKEGVSTLSKVLPPYAAQQGYDILDDKTYRLIERVLTLEESTKINAEQRRLAEIHERAAQEAREQLIYDHNLVDRFPSDSILIQSRDTDLAFLKRQVADVMEHQSNAENTLHNLQQQAAEEELSGEVVSSVLEERLSKTQQDIATDQLHIERLEGEYILTEEQYAKDLARLRELLFLNMKKKYEAK